jgi:hypothetical protein
MANAAPMVSIDAMNNNAIAVPKCVCVKLAANRSATTRQVNSADRTDKAVAQLTRLIRRSRMRSSPIHRSCSAPRLASNKGSMSRDRSTMRDRRAAQTLRKAPIPLRRKTGASARRTISATVVTEIVAGASNIAVMCQSADSRSQLATSRSKVPVTTKLAARTQAKLAIKG